MKLKAIINLFLVFTLSIGILSFSGYLIYSFTNQKNVKQQFSAFDSGAPILTQQELNFCVNESGLIIEKFKALIQQKRRDLKMTFFVANFYKITKVKIVYNGEKESGIWFYELKY